VSGINSSRLPCIVLVTFLLGGCFQANLGGTTGSTLLSIAPLRDPGLIITQASTSSEADWIDYLGQAEWNDTPALLQLLLLGGTTLDTDNIDPEALYLVTAMGGFDYAPGGSESISDTPEAVQGSWNAVASGQRIIDGGLQVSALSEASYRQLAGRLDQLSDRQVLEQLDAAARLMVTDINQDEEIDHNDILAWSRTLDAADYLGNIDDVDALATGVRAGQPGASLDTLAKQVLGRRTVVMITGRGTFEIETLNWEAPVTVDNFLRYISDDFYINIAFHRAIDGFLIQTGLWELQAGGNTVVQKPPRDPVRNESRYSISNQRGTLSMARDSNPDSANAQFFINQGDNSSLDFGSVENPDGFTVFARLTSGLPVLDDIAAIPTGTVLGIGIDVPLQIVLIESTAIQD